MTDLAIVGTFVSVLVIVCWSVAVGLLIHVTLDMRRHDRERRDRQ